jgi:kinesin family protein 2/24
LYGGGAQGGRMYRNAQRSYNGGGSDYYMEPASPPDAFRASNLKMNGEDSTGDFSPGLLDLHSFDTELLPEVVVVVYSILLTVLYFLYLDLD